MSSILVVQFHVFDYYWHKLCGCESHDTWNNNVLLFFIIGASRLHNQDMMYFNNLDHDISKYDFDQQTHVRIVQSGQMPFGLCRMYPNTWFSCHLHFFSRSTCLKKIVWTMYPLYATAKTNPSNLVEPK